MVKPLMDNELEFHAHDIHIKVSTAFVRIFLMLLFGSRSKSLGREPDLGMPNASENSPPPIVASSSKTKSNSQLD